MIDRLRCVLGKADDCGDVAAKVVLLGGCGGEKLAEFRDKRGQERPKSSNDGKKEKMAVRDRRGSN